MPSILEQYYNLSHRLRGVLTTLEGIYHLMELEGATEANKMLAAELFVKGYKQIEDFRKILEKRAKQRDKDNMLLLSMLSTLFTQVEDGKPSSEEMLAELNMMAEQLHKMIEYNRSMESNI